MPGFEYRKRYAQLDPGLFVSADVVKETKTNCGIRRLLFLFILFFLPFSFSYFSGPFILLSITHFSSCIFPSVFSFLTFLPFFYLPFRFLTGPPCATLTNKPGSDCMLNAGTGYCGTSSEPGISTLQLKTH
ncbi:hypothetical protein N657DRAFT_170669 [Parathielavia appendiculata]|uniref:Uncharacterized protein n=1 Tax=Parathielavia appendiculata TaxID=2587402 RepID=A0AAN6U584_9PEZI|nr:hypothetical protein N657DRAFT_170669 [Parathielavia appendiculata]